MAQDLARSVQRTTCPGSTTNTSACRMVVTRTSPWSTHASGSAHRSRRRPPADDPCPPVRTDGGLVRNPTPEAQDRQRGCARLPRISSGPPTPKLCGFGEESMSRQRLSSAPADARGIRTPRTPAGRRRAPGPRYRPRSRARSPLSLAQATPATSGQRTGSGGTGPAAGRRPAARPLVLRVQHERGERLAADLRRRQAVSGEAETGVQVAVRRGLEERHARRVMSMGPLHAASIRTPSK